MIKTLDLNVSGTKGDVVPKQKADRFLSIGDHIQVIPTFEYNWETSRQGVLSISKRSRTFEL